MPTCRALTPYVHLPVQSGSDRILEAMNRKHTRRDYLDVIARLRASRSRPRLHVGLHVGFPARRKTDFRETLYAVEESASQCLYLLVFTETGHTGGRDGKPGSRRREVRAPATPAGNRSLATGAISMHRSPAVPSMCCWKSQASFLANSSAAPIFAGSPGHGSGQAYRHN